MIEVMCYSLGVILIALVVYVVLKVRQIAREFEAENWI
jgi:hypothetical protein